MKKNVRQSVVLCAAVVCLSVCLSVTGCKYVTGVSPQKDIIEFKLESTLNKKDANLEKSVIGTINRDTKTVNLIIPDGTDVTKLIATFTASPYAQVFVNGTAQASGKTVQNFSSDVVYTVQAEDGTTQNYTVKHTMGPAAGYTLLNFDFKKSINTELPDDAVSVGGYLNKGTLRAFFVKFPAGTTEAMMRNLKPTFDVSPHAQLFIKGTPMQSDTTAADFSDLKNSIRMTVKAQNGDTSDCVVVPEIDLPAAPESDINKYAGSYYGELNSAYLGNNKVIIVLEKEKVTLYTDAAGMSMDYVNVEWEKDDDTCICTAYSKKDKNKVRIKNLYGKLGFSFYKKGGVFKTDTAIMGTPVTATKGAPFVWTEGCGYSRVSMHL